MRILILLTTLFLTGCAHYSPALGRNRNFHAFDDLASTSNPETLNCVAVPGTYPVQMRCQ